MGRDPVMKKNKTLAMTRSFYWQILRLRKLKKLAWQDQERCVEAVLKFVDNPTSPGLNLEKLGGGPDSNLWSIRASQELRILLAEDGDRFIFVNAGHHKPMYDWAKQRKHRVDPMSETVTDFQVPIPELPLSLSGGQPVRANETQVEDDLIDSASIQEMIQRVFSGDFAEWELFLHPEQRPLVSRHWSGAARIRGAAGTGKTVIGLHRMAELARRYPHETVLFTTFSRSLADDFKKRYQKLTLAPSNAEFANIDRIVHRFDRRQVDSLLTQQTYEAAYEEVMAESLSERLGKEYLKAEIERVIKGNGIQRLEEYLSVERLGRKRSFSRKIRKLVWELSEVWDRKLQERNAVRYIDKRIRARDVAQNASRGRYRCVIVDEAQDMTLVEMQLVRALVAGALENPVPKDGMLILDDPAQRIYPGGYRPRWAELEISGRSYQLTRNYRNLPAIYRAAKRVRGNDLVAVEDEADRAILDAELDFPEGEFERPIQVLVDSKGETPFLRDKIWETNTQKGFSFNDMAVFFKYNQQVDATMKYLEREDIPCAQLTRDGVTGDGVRVGTYDRAKGLEFRVVFLPRLGRTQFPQGNENSDSMRQTVDADQIRETRQLELDRLYIAMTRARERLLMIADEDPCDEIRRALGEEIVLRDLRGQA